MYFKKQFKVFRFYNPSFSTRVYELREGFSLKTNTRVTINFSHTTNGVDNHDFLLGMTKVFCTEPLLNI